MVRVMNQQTEKIRQVRDRQTRIRLTEISGELIPETR